MSEDSESKSKVIKVGLGIPWLAVAIGGISGWIALESTEGIIIGCLCGIVISAATYLGLIPIAGVFIYSWVAHGLFDWIETNMHFLFWYGMIWVVVYTAVTSFVLILLILAGIGSVLR